MVEKGLKLLNVYGRKMHFEKDAVLEAILNKLFTLEEIKKIAFPMPPVKGEEFYVFPKEIDRNLFNEKREDEDEETARKLILEAFDEVDKYPEKYGLPFATYIPANEPCWEKELQKVNVVHMQSAPTQSAEMIVIDITFNKFLNCYSSYKYTIACWIEQALQWAQRIYNGEKWSELSRFNNEQIETLVLWKEKDEYARVGSGCSLRVSDLTKYEENQLIYPANKPKPLLVKKL